MIYKANLVIVKMYLHAKIMFLGQGFQTLKPKQDRQTDTQTDETRDITMPHLWVIKKNQIKDCKFASGQPKTASALGTLCCQPKVKIR